MLHLLPFLPKDASYAHIHLATKAYRCRSLTTAPGDTYKAKHLFILAESAKNAIVFGVEVYVYFKMSGEHLTRQLFVPKADTTGLGTRFSAAGVMEAFLAHLLALDLDFYFAPGENIDELKSPKERKSKMSHMLGEQCDGSVAEDLRALGRKLAEKGNEPVPEYRIAGKPVRKEPVPRVRSESVQICMFTKSADAYLFPGSEKNAGKHVAPGNALFKWWVGVLQRAVEKDGKWVLKADLPGSEPAAVKRLLPAGWDVGSLYPDDAPVLLTIPVLPDDPKGRFLEHLVVESRVLHLSVRQFWYELGYRQEFRLGSVVGIIGAERASRNAEKAANNHTLAADSTLLSVKKYKKLRDYIKGQDYSSLDDIQALWTQGIPEMCLRQKVHLHVLQVRGSREVMKKDTDLPKVNVLAVKRPAVNNLNGLIKRKK